MAREIIVTGVQSQPDGSVVVSGVFWLIAPATRVIPLPNGKSILPPAASVPTWGIQTAELSAIQAGTTVEQSFTSGQLAAGTIQATLQAMYSAAQTALTNAAPASKWIGASWDGTTWTAGQ